MSIDMNWLNENKNSLTVTHLWSGDIGTGSFVLNTSFDNFDMIIYNGCSDGYGDYMISTCPMLAHTAYPGNDIGMFGNGAIYWSGIYSSDKRSGRARDENSRMRNIYGIKYK